MASLISWLKDKEHDVGNFFNQHVVQPVEHVAAPVVQSVENTVAPPQQQQNGLSLLGGVEHAVTHNPLTDVVGSILKQTGNTLNNDVVKPIERAPQNFINDVSKPIENFAVQHPVGRVLEGVGLGALRSGIGTAQGLSGLYDLASPGTGTNRFSKGLNNLAQNVDVTAQNEHVNPVLYHGSQLGTDALQLATGSGEAKLGTKFLEEAPKIGGAVKSVASIAPKIENKVADITKPLTEGNFGQRIAGKAIQNVVNPSYQAANALYTGLQAGKEASQGNQVTPAGVASNLAIGGVGFPVAGAATHEVTAPVIQKAAQALRNAQLLRPSPLTNGELANIQQMRNISGTGASLGQDQVFNNAYNSLNRVGINPNDTTAVDNLLGAHRTHNTIVQQRQQAFDELKNRLAVNNEIGGVGKNVNGKKPAIPPEVQLGTVLRNGPDETVPSMRREQMRQIISDRVKADNPNLINSDGSITLYHGTTKSNADSISKSSIRRGTYFATDKKRVMQEYANKPNSTIIETRVDPADVEYNGNGIFVARNDTIKAPQPTQAARAGLTPDEKRMGSSLGLSDQKILESKAKEYEQQQVSENLGRRLPMRESLQPEVRGGTTLQNRGFQNPEESKPILGGSSQGGGHTGLRPKAPFGDNYTSNPKKINVAEVKPGDYQKVRSNVQLVQSTVHNHAQSVIHALRKVPEAERKDFWHKVEDPTLPRSKAMQEAINRWQGLSNTVHATSQALGGDTPYRVNYARHNWDLSDPEQAALFEQLMKDRVNDTNFDPQNFRGLDSKPRVFDTVKQGEAMGFKLKNKDPINDIAEYAQKSKNQLKTQAVAKGMSEAESHIPESEKSLTQSIGYKKSIETTPQGVKELHSLFPPQKSTNAVLTSYRKINRGAKQFLLSISQFHPININLQAAPALALKGHPVRAVRGLVDSAAAINKKYSDRIMQKALQDGTMEDAARIGTPIAARSDFGIGGTMDVRGHLGERMIFERQLPAMHVQMVRGVVSDLKKRDISLDSPEARKAGNTVNEIMGYVNTELRNLSPTVQRGLGDVLLAPQFTRSKWQVLGDAFTKGGQAGSYARRAVIGKYGAEAALTLAVGALLGQKSDNIRDVLLRTLVHPSIPTPFKDKKGNTIELGLPHNYISEVGNLAGSLKRGTNGRLGIGVDLANIPGNISDYGKARLAIVPNYALKVVTNTDFANKPLYNPTSNLKDQLAQGATTLLSGHLPIGAQGLMYTNAVKNHLPQNIQQVLNTASPGANPLLKTAASSFGFTPRTDRTVGKGLSTTRYFGALDEAKRGLNRQAADAIDIYTGGKKNPVTGQYEILPNANDSRAKATSLLQNPSAIDHLISMNQKLSHEGEKVDPLWNQSKDKITKYLQYQAMPPASADKTDWLNKNKWYTAVAKQRNAFFNSLPPGDPNKPKNPFEYPEADAQTQKDMNTYSSLTNSKAKGVFLDSHPNLIKQWDAVANYNNEIRAAQGYAKLKSYPEADKNTQSFMNTYNAADKATRKGLRNANPIAYRKMIAYYDTLDLYNINKQGALGQLQGEPNYTNKSAKAIKNIGEDFYIDQNGNYHLIPAGWMLGLGSGGYGSGRSKGTPKTNLKTILAAQKAAINATGPIKAPKKPNFSVSGSKLPASYKQTALKKYTVAKPKVSRVKK